MERILMLGGGEIMVVLLFVLLLFGSNKIPEIARMLGKGLREFRRATDEIKREINIDQRYCR
jgi:sec-independent protein translocase protein TatA